MKFLKVYVCNTHILFLSNTCDIKIKVEVTKVPVLTLIKKVKKSIFGLQLIGIRIRKYNEIKFWNLQRPTSLHWIMTNQCTLSNEHKRHSYRIILHGGHLATKTISILPKGEASLWKVNCGVRARWAGRGYGCEYLVKCRAAKFGCCRATPSRAPDTRLSVRTPLDGDTCKRLHNLARHGH